MRACATVRWRAGPAACGEGHGRRRGLSGRRVQAAVGDRNYPTHRVGAPSTTRRRRGRKGDLDVPPRIGAQVGALSECVFFSPPLLFELGLK